MNKKICALFFVVLFSNFVVNSSDANQTKQLHVGNNRVLFVALFAPVCFKPSLNFVEQLNLEKKQSINQRVIQSLKKARNIVCKINDTKNRESDHRRSF